MLAARGRHTLAASPISGMSSAGLPPFHGLLFRSEGGRPPIQSKAAPGVLQARKNPPTSRANFPPQWGLLARNAREPCPLSSSQWEVEPHTGEGVGEGQKPCSKASVASWGVQVQGRIKPTSAGTLITPAPHHGAPGNGDGGGASRATTRHLGWVNLKGSTWDAPGLFPTRNTPHGLPAHKQQSREA